MAFDLDTLQPLYRLTIGTAGSSYAFQIAQKLGIPSEIIARSNAITYGRIGNGALVSVETALAQHHGKRSSTRDMTTGASLDMLQELGKGGESHHATQQRALGEKLPRLV